MSLHEEVSTAIHREIEALGSAIALSATTIAIAVQDRYSTGPVEPHVQYTSLEHLKHMARKALAGRYEPDGEENESHQGEMFSGVLQDRYPVPRERGADPVYKHRESMTVIELDWNVAQLRKSANARLRHADALQAWTDERGDLKAA